MNPDVFLQGLVVGMLIGVVVLIVNHVLEKAL